MRNVLFFSLLLSIPSLSFAVRCDPAVGLEELEKNASFVRRLTTRIFGRTKKPPPTPPTRDLPGVNRSMNTADRVQEFRSLGVPQETLGFIQDKEVVDYLTDPKQFETFYSQVTNKLTENINWVKNLFSNPRAAKQAADALIQQFENLLKQKAAQKGIDLSHDIPGRLALVQELDEIFKRSPHSKGRSISYFRTLSRRAGKLADNEKLLSDLKNLKGEELVQKLRSLQRGKKPQLPWGDELPDSYEKFAEIMEQFQANKAYIAIEGSVDEASDYTTRFLVYEDKSNFRKILRVNGGPDQPNGFSVLFDETTENVEILLPVEKDIPGIRPKWGAKEYKGAANFGGKSPVSMGDDGYFKFARPMDDAWLNNHLKEANCFGCHNFFREATLSEDPRKNRYSLPKDNVIPKNN